MMTITPFGAAGEVTGSSWLLDTGEAKILIDCGAFQGDRDAFEKNQAPFKYDVRSIDAVILTHSHLDHSGRLPNLVHAGYRGPIYATPATRDLAAIELKDAVEIALHGAARRHRQNSTVISSAARNPDRSQEQRDFSSLTRNDRVSTTVTLDDVEQCVRQFQPVEYGTPTEIAPGITLELADAGHILGAASVRLTIDPGVISSRARDPDRDQESEISLRPEADRNDQLVRIVFSGDIGNPGSAIVRDPQRFAEADVVVMEATYGNREHGDSHANRHPSEAPLSGAKGGHIEQGLSEFIALVEQAVRRGGVILIPAFSIERTQELLYAFFEWQKDAALNHTPVFLDSPMAIRATEVFRHYPRYYDTEAAALANAGRDFFRFPMLKTTLTPESSKAIAHIPAPKIIIAGSGMLSGGRILYHVRDHLADPTTTLIFVGYQAHDTLGHRIQRGDREVRVKDTVVQVHAQIETLDSLSAHADRSALLDWLGATHGVKQLILGHADEDARQSFAKLVKDKLGLTATLPMVGEVIEIDTTQKEVG